MQKDDKNPLPDSTDLLSQAEQLVQEQRLLPQPSPPTIAESLRLIHELQVHQIELEVQNHALLELRTQLEQSLENYADLFDFAPVGYFVVTADSSIQAVNLAGASLLGQERFGLINQRLGLFVTDAARPAFNAFLDTALAGVSKAVCETVIFPKDSLPRIVHLEGVGVTTETGQHQCRIAAIDMTERQQAEAALHRSEARFHGLIDHVPSISVQGYYSDGTIHYWNPASETVYGYTPQEAIGQNLLNLIIPPEMRNDVQQALRDMAATGCPLPSGELSLLHKNGGRVEVLSSHAVVPIPDGETELFCLDVDIAYRKQSEEKLRQAQNTYRGIIDSIEEAILIQDETGTIIDANYAAEKICGYPRAVLIGTHPDLFLAPGKNDPAVIAQYFQKALTGIVQHFEFWAIREDGTVYLKEIDLILGAYFGKKAIIAVARDITSRRQMDNALRAALEEKNVLLREVHHRVKNNLASILSLLELQREDVAAAGVAGQFMELSNRISSMALVHEMLYRSDEISRIEFQSYMQTLVEHLRRCFDPYGATCIRVMAPDLWLNLDAAIPCGLIVNELVTNAFKHAFPDPASRTGVHAGEITITAGREEAVITVTVADNGVGLPAHLDWTTTRTLGLRLVRMLGQHQLRGQLEFDSTQGTRCTLRFNQRSAPVAVPNG